jgi:hypothetical protein
MAAFTAISSPRKIWRLRSAGLIEKVKIRWNEIISAAPDRPLDALVRHYLARCSVDDPGGSCVFASLVQEVSRSRGAVRETFNDGLSALVDISSRDRPGRDGRGAVRQGVHDAFCDDGGRYPGTRRRKPRAFRQLSVHDAR